MLNINTAKGKQWVLNKADIPHSDRVLCQYVNLYFSNKGGIDKARRAVYW